MLSTLSRRILSTCLGACTTTRAATCSLKRYRSGTSAGKLIQEDPLEHFYYRRVVVCSGVPSSFVSDSLRDKEPEEPIDLVKARLQHANYVWQLKQLVDNVVYVPMDERYPDAVYVEDPVVVFDGTALITKIGHPTRIGESRNMKRVLEQLNFRIVELSDVSPKATMDGGDVLFTGKEFLVGLSSRTNKEGIEAFAQVFRDYPVTAVTVDSNVLHLKSMSSMAGVGVIAIGDSPAGRRAWDEIERYAHYKYDRLLFPDENAANCLFINGVILHVPQEEYPRSYHVWENYNAYPRIEVPNSEMAKADGSLTCNSIRIN